MRREEEFHERSVLELWKLGALRISLVIAEKHFYMDVLVAVESRRSQRRNMFNGQRVSSSLIENELPTLLCENQRGLMD